MSESLSHFQPYLLWRLVTWSQLLEVLPQGILTPTAPQLSIRGLILSSRSKEHSTNPRVGAASTQWPPWHLLPSSPQVSIWLLKLASRPMKWWAPPLGTLFWCLRPMTWGLTAATTTETLLSSASSKWAHALLALERFFQVDVWKICLHQWNYWRLMGTGSQEVGKREPWAGEDEAGKDTMDHSIPPVPQPCFDALQMSQTSCRGQGMLEWVNNQTKKHRILGWERM